MTRLRAFTLLFAGWLLISAPGLYAASDQAATPAFELPHLQSLFTAYKRKQAYDYARQFLAEMEGDPYFDYFYGVSAIDSGHASEGVFALERVLLSFPDDQVARLELARGYFILQEYALSREAFETVLSTQPPPRVKEAAEAYLDRIRVSESRYRPTHSGFLELALGNDDNVNAGVDENSPSPVVSLLSPESFGQDDSFSSLSGAWTYVHPMVPGWMFESTVSGQLQKNQQLSQYDTATGTLQLGFTHLQARSKYRAEIIAQQFNLDGDTYRSLAGFNLDWQYTLSQASSLNTSLQYAQLDYPDLKVKNSDLVTLGVNYVRAFSVVLQPVFFTTLSLGSEMAQDDKDPAALAETDRSIYSLRAGIMLSFNNELALQTAIGSQKSRFSGTVLFSDEKREDDYTTANIGLLWAFARKWRMDTRYSYIENSSNDDLRNYQRNVIDLTLNYTF